MIMLISLIHAILICSLITSTATGIVLQEHQDIQKPLLNLRNSHTTLEPGRPLNLNDDGFYFENPETNCKYASQPYIYDVYRHTAPNMYRLMEKIAPNVDFTIVGHHPVSGHYHDLKHVWVNVVWRLTNCFLAVYPDEFDVRMLHIHGGCDQQWSVQEVLFCGRANNGLCIRHS